MAGVSPSPLGGPTTESAHAATLPRPQGQGEPNARPTGPESGQAAPVRPAADRVGPGSQPSIGSVPVASEAPPSNGTPHVIGAPHVNGPPSGNGAHAFVPPPDAAGDPPPAPGPDRNSQCTAPQFRRFIKSRPYVPMHELRRRFGIDGQDDDVTPVRLDPGWVYVGLPSREGSLLGDLLRAGEIGYELSLDPRTPIVIGVYPMRPIPRS